MVKFAKKGPNMDKSKDKCLNYIVFVGEKEHPTCVVFMKEPSEALCKGCYAYISLEGECCPHPKEKE